MKGDETYLNMIRKLLVPRKGSSRAYFESRAEIVKAMKEDVNARRFFKGVQRLLLDLSWGSLDETQQEPGLNKLIREDIDTRIEAWRKDKTHIQAIHEFLGWTQVEYWDYAKDGTIPKREIDKNNEWPCDYCGKLIEFGKHNKHVKEDCNNVIRGHQQEWISHPSTSNICPTCHNRGKVQGRARNGMADFMCFKGHRWTDREVVK